MCQELSYLVVHQGVAGKGCVLLQSSKSFISSAFGQIVARWSCALRPSN